MRIAVQFGSLRTVPAEVTHGERFPSSNHEQSGIWFNPIVIRSVIARFIVAVLCHGYMQTDAVQ